MCHIVGTLYYIVGDFENTILYIFLEQKTWPILKEAIEEELNTPWLNHSQQIEYKQYMEV